MDGAEAVLSMVRANFSGIDEEPITSALVDRRWPQEPFHGGDSAFSDQKRCVRCRAHLFPC